MSDFSKFTSLLGPENEKRFKDEVTDILIDRVRCDMEAYDMYLFDYESILGDVSDKIEKDLKDLIYKECMGRIEGHINDIVDSVLKKVK